MDKSWPADFPPPPSGATGFGWWIENSPLELPIFHFWCMGPHATTIGRFGVQRDPSWTGEEFRSWVLERLTKAQAAILVARLP